jgi:hypothetical protein
MAIQVGASCHAPQHGLRTLVFDKQHMVVLSLAAMPQLVSLAAHDRLALSSSAPNVIVACYLSQQGLCTLVLDGQHMVVLSRAYSRQAGLSAQKEQPADITCYKGVSNVICAGQHMEVLAYYA